MIYTVNGPIKKDEIGLTLSHEHIKWENDEEYALQLYFEHAYDDEQIQHDFELILPLMKSLKAASCKTIVETSPPLGGQNLKLLKRLSDATGLQIIPCTGQNLNEHVYDIFKDNFANQVSDQWIDDFNDGMDVIDGVIIRPGYIKMLVSKGTFSCFDQEMLRAAVRASKKTGMPIHCHILEASMVDDVIKFLDSIQTDYSKFLWAHADKEGDMEVIKKAYDKGMWIGYDMIKKGTYTERVDLLKESLAMGIEDRILLSQDYDFYEEAKEAKAIEVFTTPCCSIIHEFIPLCIEEGIPKEVMDKFLIDNPGAFYDIENQE